MMYILMASSSFTRVEMIELYSWISCFVRAFILLFARAPTIPSTSINLYLLIIIEA